MTGSVAGSRPAHIRASHGSPLRQNRCLCVAGADVRRARAAVSVDTVTLDDAPSPPRRGRGSTEPPRTGCCCGPRPSSGFPAPVMRPAARLGTRRVAITLCCSIPTTWQETCAAISSRLPTARGARRRSRPRWPPRPRGGRRPSGSDPAWQRVTSRRKWCARRRRRSAGHRLTRLRACGEVIFGSSTGKSRGGTPEAGTDG